jgi:hypothetical protein
MIWQDLLQSNLAVALGTVFYGAGRREYMRVVKAEWLIKRVWGSSLGSHSDTFLGRNALFTYSTARSIIVCVRTK